MTTAAATMVHIKNDVVIFKKKIGTFTTVEHRMLGNRELPLLAGFEPHEGLGLDSGWLFIDYQAGIILNNGVEHDLIDVVTRP